MPTKEITEKIRIDRWLWAVRIFKTRNLATEACKKNWIKIDNHPVKPSKEVCTGDIVIIKLGPLQKIVKVDGITDKRISAPLVAGLLTDLTSPEAYEKAKSDRLNISPRVLTSKGCGRPTKKQRRQLDDFLYPE